MQRVASRGLWYAKKRSRKVKTEPADTKHLSSTDPLGNGIDQDLKAILIWTANWRLAWNI